MEPFVTEYVTYKGETYGVRGKAYTKDGVVYKLENVRYETLAGSAKVDECSPKRREP